jgi:hypothetical protein
MERPLTIPHLTLRGHHGWIQTTPYTLSDLSQPIPKDDDEGHPVVNAPPPDTLSAPIIPIALKITPSLPVYAQRLIVVLTVHKSLRDPEVASGQRIIFSTPGR